MKLPMIMAAAVAVATLPLAVRAQAAEATAAPSPIAGWDVFVDGLRDLAPRMMQNLPAEQRNDPQVQQEIGRLMLEALASEIVSAIGGDPDHPAFLPHIGLVMNIGQPNADTNYRTAYVDPNGVYRLRGRRGSLRMLKIDQLPALPGEPGSTAESKPGPSRGSNSLLDLPVDAQGHYDVVMSATRPEGYSGEWWPLNAGTGKLLLRMVSSDWGKEEEPTISIERLDKPVRRPRPPAADLEQRLRNLPVATATMALLFRDHVQTLRKEGYINSLKVYDIAGLGGLPGQFYYEGAYDLKDDEALIIEAKVPSQCVYHSLILTNAVYETTDWHNNHSSLNDSQSRVDGDGILRVVVSAKDPGVPNWLDIAGYPQGVVQGRWTDCNAQPVPTVRKIPVSEVRAFVPADTPEVTPAQREALIRTRRTQLQQRPFW